MDTPRRIVLMRHAKADWNDGADHERPLADRGRKDAPTAGRWLAGSGINLDLALVTTAARGRETWKLVAAELPRRPRTVYDERLYEADLGELIALINETPDDVGDLVVLGGNPGIGRRPGRRGGGRPAGQDEPVRLPHRRDRGPDLHRVLEGRGARYGRTGRLLGPALLIGQRPPAATRPALLAVARGLTSAGASHAAGSSRGRGASTAGSPARVPPRP
ncbi:SixA phosphatase family protein [Nonomuraea antimicrobica]